MTRPAAASLGPVRAVTRRAAALASVAAPTAPAGAAR
jgi:hypothetical protein